MNSALAEIVASARRDLEDSFKRRSMGQTGLVAACEDPQLLNFPLWPKQRDLLASIDSEVRLHVMALGRRGTKTTLMALTALYYCLLRPDLLKFLLPGERGYAVGVATSKEQAKIMVDTARAVVLQSPTFSKMIEADTAFELRFTNRTAFAAFACTARGTRGWPIFCLLMDEAAHFIDTGGNSAAEPMWRALVPAAAQFGDAAKIIVGSTPLGDAGFFSDLYTNVASGEIPNAKVYHATSIEMNPLLTEDGLRTERIVLGEEGFAAEYLAEFVGTGGAYLELGQITSAVNENRDELLPSDATDWVAGIDPAFSSDPFGLALVGQDRARGKLVLGVARRWLPDKPVSFEERRELEDTLLADAAETCRAYNAKVLTDQYAAPAVVERLQRAGLQVKVETMTASSKTAAFGEMRARLAASELELYREPQLLAELRRLRARFTAGRAAVINPRVGDSHGDMAQALALAVWGQRHWSIHSRPARVTVPTGTIPNAAL